MIYIGLGLMMLHSPAGFGPGVGAAPPGAPGPPPRSSRVDFRHIRQRLRADFLDMLHPRLRSRPGYPDTQMAHPLLHRRGHRLPPDSSGHAAGNLLFHRARPAAGEGFFWSTAHGIIWRGNKCSLGVVDAPISEPALARKRRRIRRAIQTGRIELADEGDSLTTKVSTALSCSVCRLASQSGHSKSSKGRR